MTYPDALGYAVHIHDWLLPFCSQIEVAGSIRRRRSNPNDIDVVAIPRVAVETDLLGDAVTTRNLLWEELVRHVSESHGRVATICGGKAPGELISLKNEKFQLDVFFAEKKTWATRLILRTGSKEHNIWLAKRAKTRGLQWNPARGLFCQELAAENNLDSAPIYVASEKEFYGALGLPFIEPINREIVWLAANIRS